jgi:hypothetical protein
MMSTTYRLLVQYNVLPVILYALNAKKDQGLKFVQNARTSLK